MAKREDEFLAELQGRDPFLEELQGRTPASEPVEPDPDGLRGSFLGRQLKGLGAGLGESVAGLVELPGLVIPGEDSFERTGREMRELYQPLRQEAPVAGFAGRLVGEGSQLALGGAGVARAGGKLLAGLGGGAARTAVRLRRALQGPARAVASGTRPSAGQRLARLGTESLIFSPVDALVGLNRARLEGSNPVQAVAEEIALGALGGGAFELVGAGVRRIMPTAQEAAQRVVNERTSELLEESSVRILEPEETAELELLVGFLDEEATIRANWAGVGSAAVRTPSQPPRSGFIDSNHPVGLTVSELHRRATMQDIAIEIGKLAPDQLARMVRTGQLPGVDPRDVRGFTENSENLLLGERGKPLNQAVLHRWLDMLGALVDSNPELVRSGSRDPKNGLTIQQWFDKAHKVKSIEELPAHKALTPEGLVAARNMVRGSVRERLEVLHQAAAQAVGPERARLDGRIAQEEAAAMVLTKVYAEDVSEAGLKLRLFREFAESQRQLDPNFWAGEARRILGDTTFAGKRDEIMDRIYRLVADEDRAGLVQLMTRLEVPDASERFLAYWKAGLLTNPKTHAVNFTSNLSFAVLERLSTEPAAFFDYVLSLDIASRATGLRELSGRRTTFSPTALRGERDLGRGRALGQELRGAVWRGARPSSPVAQRFYDARVILENAKVDLRGREVQFKLFTDPGLVEAIARGEPKSAINAFAHVYTNSIFKALGAADAYFKGFAIDASLVQSAHRLARERGGITGKELLGEWVQGTRHIPDDVVLDALLDASQRTFQDQTGLGRFFGAFQRIPIAGHLVVPFSRVMGAILTRTLEYSTFGLGSLLSLRESRHALLGLGKKRHAPDITEALRLRRTAAMQLGRGTTGAGLLAGGYWLYDAGMLTGILPEFGTRERELANAAGIGEKSIYVPAKLAQFAGLPGGWYDITRLAPGGDVVALGGIFHQRLNDPEILTFNRFFIPFLEAASLITSQPLAQGLRRIARAGEDPVAATNALILGLASSFVPVASAGVGAVTRTLDPVVREDEGSAFLRFLTRVPWESKVRPARLNAFGEVIERTPGAVANLLLPGDFRVASQDPVLQEMARVGAGVARLERGTVASVDDKGRTVLEREAIEDYQARQRQIGQAQYAAAKAAVESLTYQRALQSLVGQQHWTLEELQKSYIESRTDAVRSYMLRTVAQTPRAATSEERSDAIIRYLFPTTR